MYPLDNNHACVANECLQVASQEPSSKHETRSQASKQERERVRLLMSELDGLCSQKFERVSKPGDGKERKRLQNRLAQRTYSMVTYVWLLSLSTHEQAGRNQKERLRALEAVVETVAQSSHPLLSPDITNSSSDHSETTSHIPMGMTHPDEHLWTPGTLLEQPPTLNMMPYISRPALHRAIVNGNTTIVRLLLDEGADLKRQDSFGQTALHLAVERGCEEMVRMVLEKISDPNIPDSAGRTALFSAVQSDNEPMARLLIEFLVDVNMKDTMGEVALHLAVESGSESLTLLLIKHGADVDL